MAKQKMSIKKKASAIVAGALAVALAVGGAYAWTDYNQTARNTFRGLAAGDVVLHDDYSGENKDVYVENTGDAAVYVRVKFAEYLQVGNSSLLTSSVSEDPNQKGDPNDVTTWSTHQFVADVTVPADFTEDNACIGNAASAHNYFDWFMTGESKAYLSGTTVSDGNGYGGLSEETFEKYATNAKQPGELPEGKITIGDITTDVYNTLVKSEIVTMKEYMDLYTKNKNGELVTGSAEETRWTEINGTARWIVDTDGWAYWSKALQPYSATNLLLDAVIADTESGAILADNWVYNIDVQLQAATLNDLNAWVRDGNAAVADPDNQVATTTELGFDFLTALAGGSLTTAEGYVVGADGEYYAPEGPNAYYKLDENNDPTGDLILAGQDKLPGNEDDNMLSGRSNENNGYVEIETVVLADESNPEAYYTIKSDNAADTTAEYRVYAGIDKLLGTYDDVITSDTLGTYDIDDTDGTYDDAVRWNYLGGTKDKMLIATEYVLNNYKYNPSYSTTDANNYNIYADSALRTETERIGGLMNITAPIETVELDMSDAQHIGNAVYVCVNAAHTAGDEKHASDCGTTQPSIYYTNNASKDQANIASTKFFALSLNEVLSAYGDSTTTAIRQLRIVQAAPAYVHPNPSQGDGGYNYNNSTTWKDGDNNFITTTYYWLRSPGYDATRAAVINSIGHASATDRVTSGFVGVRPACYLNLGSSAS